jgi:hypothetical protein
MLPSAYSAHRDAAFAKALVLRNEAVVNTSEFGAASRSLRPAGQQARDEKLGGTPAGHSRCHPPWSTPRCFPRDFCLAEPPPLSRTALRPC